VRDVQGGFALVKLELAAERLANALDALEGMLAPLERARTDADQARARLSELNAERERLVARIAELEEEQQALSEISEEVETRLDGAIAEIRTALGR
jgi:chromosome segregation ATPase